jgi:hypothetical protein
MYKMMFAQRDVFSIVLEDTPENIADRMIYTDDDDLLIEDRESDRTHDINDVKYFISHYKNAHKKILCHYLINDKSASEAADEIIKGVINRVV